MKKFLALAVLAALAAGCDLPSGNSDNDKVVAPPHSEVVVPNDADHSHEVVNPSDRPVVVDPGT